MFKKKKKYMTDAIEETTAEEVIKEEDAESPSPIEGVDLDNLPCHVVKYVINPTDEDIPMTIPHGAVFFCDVNLTKVVEVLTKRVEELEQRLAVEEVEKDSGEAGDDNDESGQDDTL